MKGSLLENANVFCISSNGIVEGHHFLTLVTCHPDSTTSGRRNTRQRRFRTLSLPPSFDDDGVQTEILKLSRSSRSLSEDILRISRQRCNLKRDFRISCVSGFKLRGLEKKINRNMEIGIKRKMRHSKNTHQSSTALKSKMHKSLVSRQKHDKGSSCSAISFKMDGYMLSYFIAEMRRSETFRSLFINHWSRGGSVPPILREGYPLLVFVALAKQPEHGVLDSLGNKMVNSNILYRRSLEHALSWLSTLGGAFSALGDLSPSWAEEAGHVSLTQLRISMKLGDPGIQSRCRLYAAISLLQRGYLKSCREIVKKEYQYAMSLPEGSDPRLRRMCLGVWSKLQYHWNLVAKSDKRMLKSTLDGLQNIRNNAKYWNVYNLEEGRKIATVESIDQVS